MSKLACSRMALVRIAQFWSADFALDAVTLFSDGHLLGVVEGVGILYKVEPLQGGPA